MDMVRLTVALVAVTVTMNTEDSVLVVMEQEQKIVLNVTEMVT